MEDPVYEFSQFLLDNNVPSRVVRMAEDERMTKDVIQYMEEKDLKTLFPCFGDQCYFRPIMEKLKVS